MKIVFAADGSKCTKKALAFLVTHENLAGEGDEVLVLNVQPALPPRVRSAVGAQPDTVGNRQRGVAAGHRAGGQQQRQLRHDEQCR